MRSCRVRDVRPRDDTVKDVVIKSTVTATVFDESVVLLDLERDLYYALNEVGSFVWGLLSEGASAHESIERLCARYSVAPEVIVADVDELVDHLLAAGLVSVKPATQGTTET
jgi:Coenzyme PQQ synthesis protein D (PqqD)